MKGLGGPPTISRVTLARVTCIFPGNSDKSNSALAVNPVANALCPSFSVLFTSVTPQHKRMPPLPRYRIAFRGGLETVRT